MRHSDIDDHITGDLEALASDTRRGIGELSDVAALLDSRRSAYRDERPGLEARRDALSKRRHLELALMPLALERTFVHRVSRAAAGGAAALCAIAVMLGLAEPALVRFADLAVPGRITFNLVTAVIAAAILAAYIVAGWVAERAFERRMRESFCADSGDPHADLDALARGPLEQARTLVRRADGWSVGLMLVAVATLVPLAAFVSVVSAAFAMWPVYSLSDFALVIANTGDLMFLELGILAGVAVAVAVGRACGREHRSIDRPRVLELLEHPVVLALATVAALALLAVLGSTLGDVRAGVYISEGKRLLLAVGGTLAVIAPAAWAVLWYRRRERRRLT